MGDIGPVQARYEVLPIGDLTPTPPVQPPPPRRGSTDDTPFPTGRRENWLLRTARVLR